MLRPNTPQATTVDHVAGQPVAKRNVLTEAARGRIRDVATVSAGERC